MHCVFRLQKVRLEYSRHFDRLDIATSRLFRKKMFRIIIIYQLIDKNINWFRFSLGTIYNNVFSGLRKLA